MKPIKTLLLPVIYFAGFSSSPVFGQNSCDEWPLNPASIAPADLILTPNDTVLCGNTTAFLRTIPVAAFCWSPPLYLSDPTSPNPIASPPTSITYFFTSKTTGNNLIANGNFSAGNLGFTSDYAFDISGLDPGKYFVGDNPATWHPNMPACGDHTSGSGNMMLVNGADIAGVKVWSATISVSPSTLYEFACWATNISSTTENLCQLQFYINNVPLGIVFQSEPNQCKWKQFFSNWHSGNLTSATISIVNQSTQFTGNDFALDDITFSPVAYTQDSIRILKNSNCTSPLHLKSFNVQKRGESVLLQFETFNEEESASIEIERAFNNSPFVILNKMQLNGAGHYQYLDNTFSQGITRVYYRIKDTNKNGKVYYSSVKSIDLNVSSIYVVNSKPVRQLKDIIIYSSATRVKAEIIISDVSGHIISKKNMILFKGENSVFAKTNILAKGVYFITVTAGSESHSSKIIVD